MTGNREPADADGDDRTVAGLCWFVMILTFAIPYHIPFYYKSYFLRSLPTLIRTYSTRNLYSLPVIIMVVKVDYNQGNGSRIPASLQAVFLASNRGHEVNRPPPRNAAFKVFQGRGVGGLFRFKSSRSANTTKEASQLKMAQVLPQFQKKVSLQTSKAELVLVECDRIRK